RGLMGLTTGALAALVWRLTSACEPVVARLALLALAVGVGSGAWSERPLLLGLMGLGAVILAAEGDLDPRWLLPVAWLWVNSHGSFPLGAAYLILAALGSRLDGHSSAVELRALRWFVPGV